MILFEVVARKGKSGVTPHFNGMHGVKK